MESVATIDELSPSVNAGSACEVMEMETFHSTIRCCSPGLRPRHNRATRTLAFPCCCCRSNSPAMLHLPPPPIPKLESSAARNRLSSRTIDQRANGRTVQNARRQPTDPIEPWRQAGRRQRWTRTREVSRDEKRQEKSLQPPTITAIAPHSTHRLLLFLSLASYLQKLGQELRWSDITSLSDCAHDDNKQAADNIDKTARDGRILIGHGGGRDANSNAEFVVIWDSMSQITTWTCRNLTCPCR